MGLLQSKLSRRLRINDLLALSSVYGTNIFPFISNSNFNQRIINYLLLHNREVPSLGLPWLRQTWIFPSIRRSVCEVRQNLCAIFLGCSSDSFLFSEACGPKNGPLDTFKDENCADVFGGPEAEGFRTYRIAELAEILPLYFLGRYVDY